MPTSIRAQVLLAAGFGIAVAGCADDEVRSDLNTEGPPRVLAVTVPSEGGGVAPIYCPEQIEGPYGTEKIHPICLDAETDEVIQVAAVDNVTPDHWEVRVVFNELLDGDQVETIVPNLDPSVPEDQYGQPRTRGTFVETQPVVLRCGGTEIPYDGYYDPSGSFLTDPPGPALVVTLPNPVLMGTDFVPGSDFVASGTSCEVEVKADIRDKDGNTVLAATRGPFSFGLAPFQVRESDPNDGDEGVALDVEPVVSFNAPVDMATLVADGAARITLSSSAGDVEATLAVSSEQPTAVVLTPAAPLEPGTEYSLSVSTGITDIKASALSIASDPLVVATFTTDDDATGPDAGPEVDAGPPVDAAPVDAAPIDAAPIDAAPIDAGV